MTQRADTKCSHASSITFAAGLPRSDTLLSEDSVCLPPKIERRSTWRADVEATTTSDMSASRWFTRGWTLQELIAPSRILFYDRHQACLGDKQSLCDQIARVTGIEKEYILGSRALSEASVACRMSWASRRTTTRTEDIAYCLLGVFDVNMPLLYGEGAKAFTRLQEKILQRTNDESLFAWISGPEGDDAQPRGLFARHPKEYAFSANIAPTQNQKTGDRYVASKQDYASRYASIAYRSTTIQIYSHCSFTTLLLWGFAAINPYQRTVVIELACQRATYPTSSWQPKERHQVIKIHLRKELGTMFDQGAMNLSAPYHRINHTHFITSTPRWDIAGRPIWRTLPDFIWGGLTWPVVTEILDETLNTKDVPTRPVPRCAAILAIVFGFFWASFMTLAAPILAAWVNARTDSTLAVWLLLTLGYRFTQTRILFLLMVFLGAVTGNFRLS